MEYVIIFLFWLGFAGGVAALASSRGRSAAGWCLVALMCSPLLGAVALLLMPDLKQQFATMQREVAQVERQQEFQRAQAAEHHRLAQLEAARIKAEQARITGSEFALALEKLRQLHDKGLLTEVEYTARKRRNIDDLMDRTIEGSREDFLAELLPLIDAGGLAPEDVAKVKAIVLQEPAAASAPAPVPRALGPHPAPLAAPPWPHAPQAATTAAVATAPYRAVSTPMQHPGHAVPDIPQSAFAVQRPTGMALLAFAVPLGLVVLHLLVFGSSGVTPLGALLAVGAVSAAAISLSPATRGATSRDLWDRVVRRKAILYGAVGVVAAAEVAALYVGLSVRRWRRNFDATLANADPCAVLTLTNTDHATAEQLERRSTRQEQCRQQRAEADKEARHKRCLDTARSLAAGKPLAAYRPVLQGFAGTAGRMLSRKLTPADLADTSKATMPCEEFPDAVTAFYLAYAKAAVQVPSAWAEVKTSSAVDQDLRQLLEDRDVKLSSEADKALASVVTNVATAAAKTGKTSGDMAEAHKLCEMQASIGATRSDACAHLEARYQTLKKAEEARAAAEQRAADAKEKREQAIEDAKEKRQEAIQDAKEKRSDACLEACDRMPEGPASDACSDRCLGLAGKLF